MQRELKELLDKQRITELIYSYAQAIDRRDSELLASLFTADAVLHYGFYEGPANTLIANWRFDQPAPFLMTHHQMGNILIRLQSDDRATAISYLIAVHRARREGRLVDETVRARYLDRLVDQAGAWRFAERTLVYDWSHIAPADTGNWWDPAGATASTGAFGPADPSRRLRSERQE